MPRALSLVLESGRRAARATLTTAAAARAGRKPPAFKSPRRVVVIAFSGVMNARRAERHLTELEAFLQARGLTAQSQPTYAAYNPPWIPGPFRRNEIWVEVSAG